MGIVVRIGWVRCCVEEIEWAGVGSFVAEEVGDGVKRWARGVRCCKGGKEGAGKDNGVDFLKGDERDQFKGITAVNSQE